MRSFTFVAVATVSSLVAPALAAPLGSSIAARRDISQVSARSLMAREPDFGLPSLAIRQIDPTIIESELTSIEEQLLLDEEYAALMNGGATPSATEPPAAGEPSATELPTSLSSIVVESSMSASIAIPTASVPVGSAMPSAMPSIWMSMMTEGETPSTTTTAEGTQATPMVSGEPGDPAVEEPAETTEAPSTTEESPEVDASGEAMSAPPSMTTEIIQIIEGF